jgi:hypothetical protein
MSDIEDMKRQEADLLAKIATEKQKNVELKQQLEDDLTSGEPQTDQERLSFIFGMIAGIMKEAGYDIDSVEMLTQLDAALTDLSSRNGKDVAAVVVAEIRKVID